MGFLSNLRDVLTGKALQDGAEKPVTETTLGTPPFVIAPQIQSLADKLFIETKAEDIKFIGSLGDEGARELEQFEVYTEIAALNSMQKIQLIHALVPALYRLRQEDNATYISQQIGGGLIYKLIDQKIIYTDADVRALIDVFKANIDEAKYVTGYWPVYELLKCVKKQLKDQSLSPHLMQTLLDLKEVMADLYAPDIRIEKIIRQLLANVAQADNETPVVLFAEDDEFSTFANAQITALPVAERNAWYALIALAQNTNTAKPSAKFLAQAKRLLEDVGSAGFFQLSHGWFNWIIQSKDGINAETLKSLKLPDEERYINSLVHHFSLSDINIGIIKVIIWLVAEKNDSASAPLLAKLAERCYQVLKNKGIASAKIGNACFYALSKQGFIGISQLSRLKLRIKQPSARSLIENYLIDAANAQGLTMSELEDVAVSDYGLTLTEQGFTRRFAFADYTAVLSIVEVGNINTTWLKPDGSTQKTMPSFVKEEFAGELKILKDTTKQIEQMLTTQRDRIDRMLRENRSMSFAHFEKYYLNHGLMGYLAQRLIWCFTQDGLTQNAIWWNAAWVNANSEPLNISKNATVSLWHPANANQAETVAWRDFLLDNLILQPLKQAYRELYILTAAEANTCTYSNRMAAHILKQYQFSSLARLRGWSYNLLGAWDGDAQEIAEIFMEEHGIYAQFWLQAVEADGQCNASGIWNYVSTDQVRFLDAASDALMNLVDVPPIVFSEVMRDVDLFVGVASVGNDPNWQDSGGLPTYREYWQSYSFGHLSELAKTRKALLEKLVPRLKIKDVTSIHDKFLVVKGKLRTYKIHIGSSNILMEPNDQYLCIVPDANFNKRSDSIFLPFAGDNGLSIILSKAFLLADDDKITDNTILSQIQGH